LNKLYREGLTEEEIGAEPTPIIQRYAQERRDGEPFGDFVIRTGYVSAVSAGREFHDPTSLPAFEQSRIAGSATP
jgi:sulfite reductase (NADPH) hemoprotein beta-component